MSTPTPRPILKSSHSCGPPSASSRLTPLPDRRVASASGSPTPAPRGVHFPPAPRLARTFSAHPPSDYDRTPIVVSRNACALPERGGRVYTGEADMATARSARTGREGAGEAGYGGGYAYGFPCPPLTPDASSESDDSDACAGSPPDPVAGAHSLPLLSGPHSGAGAHSPHGAYALPSLPGAHSLPALSFLPHAPKSARHGPVPESEDEEEDQGRAPTPTPRTCKPATVRSASAPTMRGVSVASPRRSAPPSPSKNTAPRRTADTTAPPRRRRKPLPVSSFSIAAEEDCLGGF
ncbi:hypothetical protein HDZ31DRAFT_44652 [Schizophyllum fasciatum]